MNKIIITSRVPSSAAERWLPRGCLHTEGEQIWYYNSLEEKQDASGTVCPSGQWVRAAGDGL